MSLEGQVKMPTVVIPAWNSLGVLPPIDASAPTSPDRSPYPVSTPQDRLHLLAERNFLQDRLAALLPSAQMMRISIESRLRVIGEQLKLAAMEPISNREQHQLLITSTALGSFGFELEEYRKDTASAEPSPIAQALERTQNLLSGTTGTDDQLADSAADTDPRALEKIRAFLQTLSDHEAVCAMQYRGTYFRFTDVGQVRNSLSRLSQDNLLEVTQSLTGEIQGVLPKGRTFEFKIAGSDEVTRCKIGAAVLVPGKLNDWLNQAVAIKVMMTQVGAGKPRYVLIEMPNSIEE